MKIIRSITLWLMASIVLYFCAVATLWILALIFRTTFDNVRISGIAVTILSEVIMLGYWIWGKIKHS